MEKLIKKIQLLMSSDFWGELTIKFQNGKPVMVSELKQEKLDN